MNEAAYELLLELIDLKVELALATRSGSSETWICQLSSRVEEKTEFFKELYTTPDYPI